jgi:hypothetical protein
MEHPINIFHVIKRMANDWREKVHALGEVESTEIEGMYNYANFMTPSPM